MENVSFHRLAERELNEAAHYYDLESSGLGGAFLDEVERTLQLVLEYPCKCSAWHHFVQQVVVEKYPFRDFTPSERKRYAELLGE